MTVYITGDCHGKIYNKFFYDHDNNPYGEKYDECWLDYPGEGDYVIVAGDFGSIWDEAPSEDNKSVLEWLNNECHWKTIIVLGNHENWDVYDTMPVNHDSDICVDGYVKSCVYDGKNYENIIIVDKLAVLNIDGKSILCIAGAQSHDKEWRIEGISWWPQEEIDEDAVLDFLEKYDGNTHYDYIVTHEAPGVINKWHTPNGFRFNPNHGQKLLDMVKSTVSFGKWFHGHMHFNYGWPVDKGIMFGVYNGVHDIETGEAIKYPFYNFKYDIVDNSSSDMV